MSDTRKRNLVWQVTDDAGNVTSWEQVHVAVLMDIRDELQGVRAELRQLNGLLHCENFVNIPHVLSAIKRNTTKRKRAAKLRAVA